MTALDKLGPNGRTSAFLELLSEPKISVSLLSTHLTEYLGAGKSESGESDGSIMGTGEEEGERSGESGPSVAELRSEAGLLRSHSCVSGLDDTTLSSIITPPGYKLYCNDH